MTRRLRSLERRLARLAALFRDPAAEAEKARALDEARKLFAALTRDGIRRAGLDPDKSRTLRSLEARRPAAPPPPPRRRLDPCERLFARFQTLAARMRGGPPNLATASPAMLFAYYCLGEGAREAPA